MGRSKNDVWVGLFVLLGALAVLFLALKSANLLQWNFSHDYQVSAKFDNIGGLKPGAAVAFEFVERGQGEWVITAVKPSGNATPNSHAGHN